MFIFETTRNIFVSTVIKHARWMENSSCIPQSKFIYISKWVPWCIKYCESVSMCTMLTEGHGDFAA